LAKIARGAVIRVLGCLCSASLQARICVCLCVREQNARVDGVITTLSLPNPPPPAQTTFTVYLFPDAAGIGHVVVPPDLLG